MRIKTSYAITSKLKFLYATFLFYETFYLFFYNQFTAAGAAPVITVFD